MLRLTNKEFQEMLSEIPMLKTIFENALREKIRKLEQVKEEEKQSTGKFIKQLSDMRINILDLLEAKYGKESLKLCRKLIEISKLDVLKSGRLGICFLRFFL